MSLLGKSGALFLTLLVACEAPATQVVPARDLPPTARTAPIDGVPNLTDPVTDLAGLLVPDEVAALDQQVRDVRDATGVQIALLTIPALPEGLPIEDFSLQTAQQWRGGSERDDGVLVTLAWRDRRSRIDVGYGLEGYVTDAEAGQLLIRAAPFLRANDTVGALSHVVDGLHAEVASLQPGDTPPLWRRAYGLGARWTPPRSVTSMLGLLAATLFTPWLVWSRRRRGYPARWRGRARGLGGSLWLAWLGFFGGGAVLLWLLGAPASVAGFVGSAVVGTVVQLPIGFAQSTTDLRQGLWTAGICLAMTVALYLALALGNDGIPPEFAWLVYGTLGLGMVMGASGGGGGDGGGGGSWSDSSSGGGSSGSSSGGSDAGGDWSGGGGSFGGGGASGTW